MDSPFRRSSKLPGLSLSTDLLDKCNDAYWMGSSDLALSDRRRMAAALRVVAEDLEAIANDALGHGFRAGAAAIHAAASLLRRAAGDD